MSEELAKQMQDHEDHAVPQTTVGSISELPGDQLSPSAETAEYDDIAAILAAAGVSDGDTSSDEIIARMLQLQFDKEHNTMLDKEAKKFNGTSKVTISFDNYKTRHPAYEQDLEDEDDENADDFSVSKTKWEERKPTIGAKGYAGSGKNVTTKHDKVITGRRNAERMMDFPPEFGCGDGEGMDMQLPNNVYNSLKLHSQAETRRGSKQSEKKEHSTAEHVVDPKTRQLLFKLVNSGVLQSIGGVIAGGKESLVFQAEGGSVEGMEIPKGVAIKIFKTTLMDFRTREKYIHGDHRFSNDDYKKQNPRKIIRIWAEKEVANLNRMQKFGVPCPSVVSLKKHVLVMSLIGGNSPAPKLKDASLSVADLQDAYEQTLELMKTLHRKCALVHADLSEFNLLWHEGTVYVIDVSQAVDLTHPQAFNFLYRDCCNISTFFKKQGSVGVLSAEKMFNEITGFDIQGVGADFSAQVQRYDKERRETDIVLDHTYSQFGFDFFFEKAQQERAAAADAAADSDEDEEEEVAVSNEEDDGDQKYSSDAEAVHSPADTSSLQLTRKSVSAMAQKYLHEPDQVQS